MPSKKEAKKQDTHSPMRVKQGRGTASAHTPTPLEAKAKQTVKQTQYGAAREKAPAHEQREPHNTATRDAAGTEHYWVGARRRWRRENIVERGKPQQHETCKGRVIRYFP